MELGGSDVEGVLLGGVIVGRQAQSFRDSQPAGVEVMLKGVATLGAVGRPRVGSFPDLLLKVVEEATEFLGRKDVRAIGLRSRRGDGQGISPQVASAHQVAAKALEGVSPTA